MHAAPRLAIDLDRKFAKLSRSEIDFRHAKRSSGGLVQPTYMPSQFDCAKTADMVKLMAFPVSLSARLERWMMKANFFFCVCISAIAMEIARRAILCRMFTMEER